MLLIFSFNAVLSLPQCGAFSALISLLKALNDYLSENIDYQRQHEESQRCVHERRYLQARGFGKLVSQQ